MFWTEEIMLPLVPGGDNCARVPGLKGMLLDNAVDSWRKAVSWLTHVLKLGYFLHVE